MAEVTQYLFTHRELTELLIKNQGLHEGLWTVSFQLGVGVANLPPTTGGDPLPATITLIQAVGLQRVDKEGPAVLDAAKVNPKGKLTDK